MIEKPKAATKSEEPYYLNGKSFEVRSLDVLKREDLLNKDNRIIITTASGNRYFISWSESANSPRISSERDKSEDPWDVLQDVYTKKEGEKEDKPVARVGEEMRYKVLDKKNVSDTGVTTRVVKIEVRVGVEKELRENGAKPVGLAQMLINHARGGGNVKE